MKLQYKNQQFQLDAVEAITSIFEGQPRQTSMSYMMDIGKEKNITLDIVNGFKNADISLSDSDLLKIFKQCKKRMAYLRIINLLRCPLAVKIKIQRLLTRKIV